MERSLKEQERTERSERERTERSERERTECSEWERMRCPTLVLPRCLDQRDKGKIFHQLWIKGLK